jgi:hypothetical protein
MYKMQESTLTSLFGPLNRKYCIWFYWLSVRGFIFLVLLLASSLYVAMTKKVGLTFFYAVLSSAVFYGISYFQNRLLYTMCVGSN